MPVNANPELLTAPLVAGPDLVAGSDLDSLAPEPSAGAATRILKGTSTLGASVALERGATFLANILAARLAGASVFGAYSLGITTANNISTYAAGGIGATATRFSGKYPYESGSYRSLAGVLGVVSLASAIVAALALVAGAGPIAHLLGKPGLTTLLRWAALPAAGMIVLECARGFFVGQRRLRALALLSVLVGVLMLALLPALAHTGHPARMLTAHGAVTLSAVLVCLALARPLSLLAPARQAAAVPFSTLLREVWGFGLVQLSGLLSANLAGWWITALIARGDPTLVQVGFFAIASQLRNLTGLVPSLLTEGSFAEMASQHDPRLPQRIMALCTFASTFASVIFASVTIVIAPWALRAVYGRAYTSAAEATAIAVSVAVLQMGNAPTSARLSIVAVRSTAAINAIWAVTTALVGTLLMLHGGTAAGAMAVFFLAHVLMGALVLGDLHRKERLPPGLVALFVLSTAAVLTLSLLSVLRARSSTHAFALTALMAAVAAAAIFGLHRLGSHHAWLPSTARLRSLLRRLQSLISGRRQI